TQFVLVSLTHFLLFCAGSPQALGKREDCLQRNGFCAFLKCPSLSLIAGKCSTFQLCCKTIWG
uniref:Beta-defensin-like domain-containing protein n=1 Tax=Phasianus colchicus TaxID=9054 RepID=A0A669QJ35_PHACC